MPITLRVAPGRSPVLLKVAIRLCDVIYEPMSRSVQTPRVINIEDLRRAAKRRLPRVVFDYIDGGAEDERTLRANCHAFEEVTFRPRCAVATPACDLRVSVLGRSLSMPLILAPVGSSRLMYPRGEEAAASAAGAAGIAYTLSTLSGCRLEDVAAASKGLLWYQLYLVGGRDCALSAIERAKAAGFSALVVTIDTAVAGMRERDLRNGAKELLSGNLRSKLPFVSQLLIKPRWLAGFLADGGLMKFPECSHPRKRADALCGCYRCSRALGCDLGGSRVDSTSVGRAHCH